MIYQEAAKLLALFGSFVPSVMAAKPDYRTHKNVLIESEQLQQGLAAETC